MKCIILGVGRSGTTAIYTLIKQIFQNIQTNTKCFYEPFLWEKENFSTLDSLFIEGMYHHRKLPLFIHEDNLNLYANNNFLQNILDHDNLVVKFIRANGRVRLINQICPDCKIIFIIRNPLDVLNSSKEMFSFYGDGYHESDRKRFGKEIHNLFPEDTHAKNLSKHPGKLYHEALYWYFMNKKFLSDMQEINNDVLTIPYELFNRDKNNWSRTVCDFLSVDYADSYPESIRQKIAPTLQKTSFSQDQLEELLPFMDDYAAFLDTMGYANQVDLENIKTRYATNVNDQKKHTGSFPENIAIVPSSTLDDHFQFFKNFFDLFISHTNVVCYGAGYFAHALLANLRHKDNIKFIVDDAADKSGEKIEGIPVCGSEALLKEIDSYTCIVLSVNKRHEKKILQKIEQMGLKNKQVFGMYHPLFDIPSKQAKTQNA